MRKVTIAGARVSCNMTQRELADKIGVSRETVLAWETGKRKIKTAYLRMICDVTGFDMDDFLLPGDIT